MNKNKLKVYAPQAREEFIKVISERAALYGITEKKIEPFEIKGDYLFISGKPFPKLIDKPRKELIARIESKNFGHVMEEIAYTWFNRFAAIRFMEINGYLEHGYRVLSHPGGHSEPEILEKAHYLESLDGLSKDEIVALKTAGNKDSDLYRKLIIAQCNELHSAMPFLFEKVDDPTELLLPDNLLNTDSITRQLVTAIPEEDWKAVEIIGWLYQFYISEKKDALMKAKKAYKTEDIPAVTQLFTPNWIVKYLVQNSLGAKWLATYPSSKIKEKMEYYIEPAEQTEDVKEQLKTVTPDVLDPEELTVMDPACGSGHILVEAYDLLKEIYLERGYRPKDIPALIITKNLFGLEIDERAAQLSGFALMMKARADDSRIFSKEHIEPNVVCIQETANLDRDGLLRNINTPLTNKSVSASSGEMDFMDEISTPLFAKVAKETDVLTEDEKLTITDLNELLELFESAKTFGSLIRIPEEIMEKLPLIRERLKKASASGDLMARQSADLLKPYFRQTVLMGHQYDCVIANPPYMGSGGMNRKLKEFVAWKYPAAKSDLMTCFMERCKDLSKKNARVGMINLPSWLFLASFEKFRHNLLNSTTIENLTHLGRGLFGADFGSVAFVFRNSKSNYYFGTYRRLFVRQSEVSSVEELKRRYLDSNYGFYKVNQEEFKQVPGYPVVYWISPQMRKAFIESELLENIADARIGMATGNNEQYVRNWHEVNISKVGFQIKSREESKLSCKKWFPLAKGGAFRKWYGNMEHVVDWANDGHALQTTKHPSGERIWAHNFNLEQIFKPAICWTTVTISDTGFRFHPHGFLYDAAAGLCQPKQEKDMYLLLGALNARVSNEAIKLL
ncbi:MAG: BREX-1 system adenine-specific DNA-methyltransferase PglX, partial [Nitrosomonas ureae]